MKRTFASPLVILLVLIGAAGYLYALSSGTQLPYFTEVRQKMTEMLHTQSNIQELLLIGQQRSIYPNSAIQEEIQNLTRQNTTLQAIRVQNHLHDHSDLQLLIEQIHFEQGHEISTVERLLTLDSTYRNSLAYIESASEHIVSQVDAKANPELALNFLLLRSQIASLWATKSNRQDDSRQLIARLESLKAEDMSAECREWLSLLQRHTENAQKVEPKIERQMERLLDSELVRAIQSADQLAVTKIAVESNRVQYATQGFAVVIVALIAFVVSLLWEVGRKTQLLEFTNTGLEEKVKEEAEKIRNVEEALFQSRKLESIGALAAGIAHEINTPMQCVTSNVEYLKGSFNRMMVVFEKLQAQLFVDEPLPRAERIAEINQLIKTNRVERLCRDTLGAIEDSESAGKRVVEIVRAMKSMTHPGTASKVETDVNELLQNATTISRSHWKESATLELKLAPESPKLICLPSELNQVVLNLVVNAADAIAEKPGATDVANNKITVSSSVDHEGVRIEVSDTGKGIPEELQRRVFDPFFTTKEVGKGTGQGLAFAHDIIINKHGGQLRLESKVGVGSTFSIWLPSVPCEKDILCES